MPLPTPVVPKVYRGYRYAVFLLDRFKYLVLLALIAFLVSTAVIYVCHPEQADPATRHGLDEVAFGVFELMFASEPALPYPEGSLPAQVVYFALSLYGWYEWLYGGENRTELHVSRTTRTLGVRLVLVGGASAALLGTLLARFTDAALPYLDSATTSTSLVAQWMMRRKIC